MAPLSLIGIGLLALSLACWKPPPVTPTPPRSPAPLVAKPRGIVLIARLPAGQLAPVLFWNDLDAGVTGELAHNITLLPRVKTVAKHAAWFASDDEVQRVGRPPKGPGVTMTEVVSDRLFAVSPDATLAAIGCSPRSPCQLAKLGDTAISEEGQLGTALPYDDAVSLEAWLPDGRLLYQQHGPSARIWYVDPKTDKATRGRDLARPFSAITDDGSMIAWDVEVAPGKQVVRWKRLRDGHEMSFEVTGSTIDCHFTPISHILYCVVAPVSARKITDEKDTPHNRLFVIDPATGTSRELAGDLPQLDAHYTAGSADGRYLAYTSYADQEQLPMIIDLRSGETFPAGPTAVHTYIVGWLAPR